MAQAQCEEEVRRREEAEAQEAATAEEKNRLKGGLRDALEGREAQDRELALAQEQAQQLRLKVCRPPTSSYMSLSTIVLRVPTDRDI